MPMARTEWFPEQGSYFLLDRDFQYVMFENIRIGNHMISSAIWNE